MRSVFSRSFSFSHKFLAPVAMLCAATFSSQAASVIYNFSFSGIDTEVSNVTATGTGSFTVDYTNLGFQPPNALTNFSFAMTLTESGAQPQSSTFFYTLGDVPVNTSVILGGTLVNPIPNQIAVVTKQVDGTNPLFGSVAVDLNMLPSGGAILTSGISPLGDISGTAVWTSIVAVPEPATAAFLLAGALLLTAAHFRSRLLALFVS